MLTKFAGLNVQVLGISVDHVPCLKAWAESLGGIHYPLLSDFWPHGEVAEQYGVLRHDEGITERAIFIIDKKGIIRYIDVHDIDSQPDNDVLLSELEKIAPEDFTGYKEITLQEDEEELPKGGVVVYCTPWCPSCRQARLWLQNNHIEYVEVNIDRSPAAAKRVQGWADGFRTTPTFDINGEIQVGFDEKRLRELLKME